MKALELTTVTDQTMDEKPAEADNREDDFDSYYEDDYEEAEGRYTEAMVAANAESFDEAARDLIGWMEYGSSGAYEDSTNSLRKCTMSSLPSTIACPILPQRTSREHNGSFRIISSQQ